MKKVLFLIHDLGPGGAEKVLVNLVNNMDYTKFDVTVMTLFDCGANRQFLSPKVKYKTWCHKMVPGNSHLMKICSPKLLHKMIVREHYDVEVAYLEGPCARVISGCQDKDTRLISWIHIEQHTTRKAATSFRSISEATKCYNAFDKIVCVSETVRADFESLLQISTPTEVLYNTNESEKISGASKKPVTEVSFPPEEMKLVGVGKLLKNKGFDRILRITNRLVDEGYPIHTYILGDGPEKENLLRYIEEKNLQKRVSFLGYQLNPYKYVSKCDLFLCASYAEGFSTAATEALIVGTPVCTVEVSGMREMLGDNEYGVITANDEESLYYGIQQLLDNPQLLKHYRKQAVLRGSHFSTEETVKAVERSLLRLCGEANE